MKVEESVFHVKFILPQVYWSEGCDRSTLTSHDQAGDAVRDARARRQKRDAHDDIGNAERVSDDRHLQDRVKLH